MAVYKYVDDYDKNIEHRLSRKFYLNYRSFDWVISKYRRVRFLILTVKSLLMLWKSRSWF